MGERSNGKRITYRPWNPRESHDTCFLYQADVLGTWYSTAPYVKLFDTAFGHSSGYFLNDISRVLPVVKGIMLQLPSDDGQRMSFAKNAAETENGDHDKGAKVRQPKPM